MRMRLFVLAFVLFTIATLIKTQAQESSPPPAMAGAAASTGAAPQKADTEIDGVTAELISVTRSDGDTLTIKYKFANSSQKEVELDLTGYSPDNIAAKVYYIDGKNKKKYLVVTDAARAPICSNLKGNTKLDPGGSKSGWSKLPAPPAGVTTISVYLPGTPPFEGVNIAAQ